MLRTFHVYLVKYFVQLTVAFHELPSLIGFFLLLTLYSQIASGIVLSVSLITESMFIPLGREEEDCENLHTDDFFWIHERGVDLVVVFLFLHLLRKFYMGANTFEQEFAWKSGATLFLLMQGVIFFGLVLCCTHLSDMTLTIAVNVFNTLCAFTGKLYWMMFPDQSLNSDTVTSLAYMHYALALVVTYFGLYHGLDMHYDWKNDSEHTGVQQELNWFDEVLSNELGQFLVALFLIWVMGCVLYGEPEALNYELFMWGDVGMVTDIRFFGVAPHWYFSPYMGWLVACPFHYTGLMGLAFFFVIFYFQPNILKVYTFFSYKQLSLLMLTIHSFFNKALSSLPLVGDSFDSKTVFYIIGFVVFSLFLYYTFSYLPFGRFFNSLGGNTASLIAYTYMYYYLGTTHLRISALYTLFISQGK